MDEDAYVADSATIIEKVHLGQGASVCVRLATTLGGVHGYTDFVAAMADPDHPDRHDMLGWYGRPFDPTVFDIAAADMRLHRIKV